MREPSVWRRPAISSIRSRLNLSSRASPTDPALREKESESRDLVFAERDLAIDWQNSPERHRQSQQARVLRLGSPRKRGSPSLRMTSVGMHIPFTPTKGTRGSSRSRLAAYG